MQILVTLSQREDIPRADFQVSGEESTLRKLQCSPLACAQLLHEVPQASAHCGSILEQSCFHFDYIAVSPALWITWRKGSWVVVPDPPCGETRKVGNFSPPADYCSPCPWKAPESIKLGAESTVDRGRNIDFEYISKREDSHKRNGANSVATNPIDSFAKDNENTELIGKKETYGETAGVSTEGKVHWRVPRIFRSYVTSSYRVDIYIHIHKNSLVSGFIASGMQRQGETKVKLPIHSLLRTSRRVYGRKEETLKGPERPLTISCKSLARRNCVGGGGCDEWHESSTLFVLTPAPLYAVWGRMAKEGTRRG